MGGEAHLTGDLDAFGLGLHAVELDAAFGGVGLHAVEPPEEVEMPPRAAEFAVSRELEPDRLLLLDDLFDLGVLDLLELRSGDRGLCMLAARLLQWRSAQQATDMIGAKRWRFSLS